MIDFRHLLRLLVLWGLVALFSFITAVKLAYSWFRKRGNYFVTEQHKKPQVLNEWTDGYLNLSEVRLHYVEGGDKTRPTMLFVHGFPQFWYCWRHQLRHFQSTYHVVALDMRGYGESDKPKGIEPYRVDRLVKDLDEAIQHFGGKVILVGHDWGAIVCWTLAAERPSVIDKLIIMNAPEPRAFRHVLATSARQLLASWYMFMFQIPVLAEAVFSAEDYRAVEMVFRKSIKNKKNLTDDDIEAYKWALSQENGLTGPLNWYRAAPVYMHDVHRSTELAGLVASKTLIIWGELDTALTVAGAHTSLRFCSDAELKLIPTASHFVQEDEPDKVNAYIQDFLAQVDWPTLDDAKSGY